MSFKEVINNAGVEIKNESKGMFEFLAHSDMNFEGKKENEEILIFTRRHWFVLVNVIFGGMFASLLPLLLIVIGAKILITYHLTGVFTLVWTMYIMIIWFAVFYKLTMHALDTWIATNERIIDISQVGLFRRKVSELHLESIQDVSVNTNGAVQSYLDYGNVEIQTGGAVLRFLFEEVPHPIKIKDTIMEAAGKFEVKN